MSAVSDVDSEALQPHAYVQFDSDEVRSCVPLSFIVGCPSDWRDKRAWNDKYLYKVFWSPDEDESPESMLKHVAQIPIYERGSSMEKPGYYRASVLMVEESLSALEEMVGKKRVSVGLLKYKTCSFDGASSEEKGGSVNPTVRPTNNPTKSFKAKSSRSNKELKKPNKKSTKPKGLNVSSHVKNINFAEDMKKKYPFLKEQDKEAEGGVKPKERKRSSGSNRKGDKSKSDSADESEPEVEITAPSGNKIMKLDPNYSPMKAVEIESKLAATEKNLSNSYIKIRKLEAARDALQKELDAKNCEVEELKSAFGLQSEELKTVKLQLHQKEEEVTELRDQIKFLIQREIKDTNADDEDSFFESPNGGDDKDVKSRREATIGNNGSGDDKYLKSRREEAIGNNGKGDDKDLKSREETIDTNGNGDDKDVEGIDAMQVCQAQLLSDTSSTEDFKLCDGVTIAANIWKKIQSRSKNEKNDKAFIKDLTMAAFGPEIVAASTVCGTKKGGGRIRTEDRVIKPGLDKEIVNAVRAQFIKRVEADLNKEIKDPEQEERTTLKMFHRGIQNGQKRLKSMGYGVGRLSNDVLENLLVEL